MPPLRVLAILCATLSGPVLSCPAAAADPSPASGRWAGKMVFRGDATPARLDIRVDERGPRVRLDLPELVMHGEPVPAERDGSGLAVELPFGIGSISLALEEGALRGSRLLGDDLLTLELGPDGEPPLPSTEIQIRRGGAVLKGTLVSPQGPGPHPAVVLLHGSATISRGSWAYRSWAWAMARRGVAALASDRRGSGESTSTEDGLPGFDELAGDALAWVEHLRAMPSIREDGVGLMGGSQAGWVAPLATTRSENVAFLILKAAPARTPADQEIQSAVGRARARGMGPEDLSRLRSYLRLYFFVAETRRGWDLLQEEIRRAQSAPWADLVDQPETLEQLGWWGRHAGFDPAEILPRISAPVLAAYGSRDLIVPPLPSAPILEHLLRSGGNERVRVMILDGADHRLERPMGPDATGRWRWPRIAPELLEALEGWVREITASTAGARSPRTSPPGPSVSLEMPGPGGSPVDRPGSSRPPRAGRDPRSQYFRALSTPVPVRDPSHQSLVRSHHRASPLQGPNRL